MSVQSAKCCKCTALRMTYRESIDTILKALMLFCISPLMLKKEDLKERESVQTAFRKTRYCVGDDKKLWAH